MADIKIKTKGMHCPSCEILLTEALRELNGVSKAEASFKSGVVSVEFDNNKVNEKNIIEVIKLEGYEVE